MPLSPEQDFVVAITTGSLVPGGAWRWVFIAPNGECLGRQQPNRNTPRFIVHHHYLGQNGIDFVATLVEDTAIWNLHSRDAAYVDGDFVQVQLRHGGRSHTVTLRNASEPEVEEFVRNINAILPEDLQIHYNALDFPGLKDVVV